MNEDLVAYLVRMMGPCPPHNRRGQWAYNILHTVRPDLAGRVHMTSCDPFYDDGILPEFFLWVTLNWGP